MFTVYFDSIQHAQSIKAAIKFHWCTKPTALNGTNKYTFHSFLLSFYCLYFPVFLWNHRCTFYFFNIIY